MDHEVTIQIVSDEENIPAEEEIERWVLTALQNLTHSVDITLRIVDAEEAQDLNRTYRNKDYATNVLSFPYEVDEETLIGDIVLCAPVIHKEALEQGNSWQSHWAHLIIHGLLHLAGHDHETDEDSKIMQEKEIQWLKQIGFKNPYHEEHFNV